MQHSLTNKIYQLFLFAFIVVLCACHPQQQTTQGYHIVYKNDKEGNVISGSKQDLIDHIRSGSSIKIGWGVKGKSHSIEHISKPIWLAVLDEQEVVAHLDPQVLSKTDWESLSVNYADSTLLEQEWRVAISTKGSFDAVWYDRVQGKVSKRRPQNHTMTWFAEGDLKDAKAFFIEVK